MLNPAYVGCFEQELHRLLKARGIWDLLRFCGGHSGSIYEVVRHTILFIDLATSQQLIGYYGCKRFLVTPTLTPLRPVSAQSWRSRPRKERLCRWCWYTLHALRSLVRIFVSYGTSLGPPRSPSPRRIPLAAGLPEACGWGCHFKPRIGLWD